MKNHNIDYVVYFPTRDDDGNYVKKIALIPERYDVSIGYLPLTQDNILKVAFNLLGNRYSWGGILGSYDCSLYVRAIYSCFGLKLPTNTTWQRCIPNKGTDISDMTVEEKIGYLKNSPSLNYALF